MSEPVAGLQALVVIDLEGSSRTVIVRELTVARFRQWLADAVTSRSRDYVLAELHAARDAADLVVFTDLVPDEIEALTPSQISVLWGKAEELNPDFFVLLGRVAQSPPSDNLQTSNAAS